MNVAYDLNSAMRVLDGAELEMIAAGCPCGSSCPNWGATLVHPGEQAPANSFYLDSISSGAIFIAPGHCLQN
jgi:hypothetical protein